jgi:hypothetical protein
MRNKGAKYALEARQTAQDAANAALDAELAARCECGHRHPEHSLSGPCHGCHCCDDDDDRSDHVYERCRCTAFVLAGDVAVEAASLTRVG